MRSFALFVLVVLASGCDDDYWIVSDGGVDMAVRDATIDARPDARECTQ